MIATTARSLPAIVKSLVQRASPSGRVLSVYLDTSPERAARDAFLMAYIDGVKPLRASIPPTDSERFEAAAGQAEAYLREEFRKGPPGVALFASGDAGYFYAVPLPQAPADAVSWGERAEVGTLQTLLDDLERVALALVDSRRARIFTVRLGAIEDRRELEDDVPSKQATGGWYSLAQTSMTRHREDHLRRHIKHTTAVLMETLRSRPFDRLFIGGPAEALSLLEHQLPQPLRLRLAGTVRLPLSAGDAEVLRATLDAADAAERQAELTAVDAVLSAGDGARASVGLDATVAALNERRVDRLLLSDEFHRRGGVCSSCDSLVLDDERCPTCHSAVRPLADLRETIVQAALGRGAAVETIRGPAGRRLAEHGGIAATTRRGSVGLVTSGRALP